MRLSFISYTALLCGPCLDGDVCTSPPYWSQTPEGGGFTADLVMTLRLLLSDAGEQFVQRPRRGNGKCRQWHSHRVSTAWPSITGTGMKPCGEALQNWLGYARSPSRGSAAR